jgi:hypothetical protein
LRGSPGLVQLEDQASWLSIDGYTDGPAAASADEGRAYLSLIIAAVADCYVEMATHLRRFRSA